MRLDVVIAMRKSVFNAAQPPSPNHHRRDHHGHRRHHHDLGKKDARSKCCLGLIGSQVKASEEAQMKYKPKSIAALQIALGGLPDKMRVQADPGIRVSAKTVGELRKVTAWPE